jgi:hypothetical protein
MVGKQDTLQMYTPLEGGGRRSHEGQPRSWHFGLPLSFWWMTSSFLGGVAFAVGHHFFYANFNDRVVDEVFLSQTWIVRIGTGLAFVAKSLLVVAAGIAFVQQQWLCLSQKSFKVRQVDTITSVLDNAFSFFESHLWFKNPSLTLLALVAWLLPIAAVVTPAAINVVGREDSTTSLGSPAQLYLDPLAYGNLNTVAVARYIGPSPDTLRTAYGSAMTGRVLDIPQTQPNMTYNLSFIAPALRCDHGDDALISQVNASYHRHLMGIENEYHYIAWAPTDAEDRGNLSFATGENIETLDTVSTDGAHLFIIPNTTVTGPIRVGGMLLTPEDSHFGYQDILDCKLYNASYKAAFNFTFPTQQVTVDTVDFLNPVNVSEDTAEWQYQEGSEYDLARQAQRISYQAIMESFGRLLAGYEWWRDGFVVTQASSWNMMSIDWTTREGAQKGVEQLFENITLSMLSTPSLRYVRSSHGQFGRGQN